MIGVQSRNGYTFYVDECDLELVNSRSWGVYCYYDNGERQLWYVISNDKNSTRYLHRIIKNSPDEMRVDHIDGNGLNNTRDNLRVCDHIENLWNTGLSKSNTTGFKGVCYDKSRLKWHSSIKLHERLLNLGRYDTAEQAALAHDILAVATRSEYAWLNFPDLRQLSKQIAEERNWVLEPKLNLKNRIALVSVST